MNRAERNRRRLRRAVEKRMRNTTADTPGEPPSTLRTMEEVAEQRARAQAAVAAAEAAERERDAQDLRDIMEGVLRCAERQTGHTRAELLEMFKTEPPPAPPAPPRYQPSRADLIARGAPELHLDHVFGRQPMETKALTEVRRFMARRHPRFFLVLGGGVGTGKTAAAVWALTQAPGRFERCSNLKYYGGLEKRPDFDRLCSTELLVLDDLGTESGDTTGWFDSIFNALVSHRYDKRLRTIITHNLDPLAFSAYDLRVVSRIREVAYTVDVGDHSLRHEMDNQDKRKRAMKGEPDGSKR